MKNANVVLWSSYLLGTAQRDMIDANRQLITDTPDAIWAGETYRKFIRDLSPPGSIGFNWNECQTTFMQGRAAMWVDGIGFAAPLEDKARSRIAGKVGYAVVPRGPGPNHHCALFGAGYAIPEASKKKGPAWFYIQWALGKSNQLQMADLRRRRAGPQQPLPQRGGDRRQPLPARVLPDAGGAAPRSPAPACRRSCPSPSSAT